MPSGIFNLPRPFASADLYLWISVEQNNNLEPSELEISKAVAETLGPDVDVGDLHVEHEEVIMDEAIDEPEDLPEVIRVTAPVEYGAINEKTMGDIRMNINTKLPVQVPSRDIGVTVENPK